MGAASGIPAVRVGDGGVRKRTGVLSPHPCSLPCPSKNKNGRCWGLYYSGDPSAGGEKPLTSRSLNRERQFIRIFGPGHLPIQDLGAVRLSYPLSFGCLSVGRCITRSKGTKNLPGIPACQCKPVFAPLRTRRVGTAEVLALSWAH